MAYTIKPPFFKHIFSLQNKPNNEYIPFKYEEHMCLTKMPMLEISF